MSAQRPQYGQSHKAIRAEYEPLVEAGEADCCEVICLEELDGNDRWIEPGSPWHLAHDRTDPTGNTYLGPAHGRCNSSEGAAFGNAQRLSDNDESLWWEPC